MLKEYVIDLRDFDGKLRELISTGLQDHAFRLGWKWTMRENTKEARNISAPVLYFDEDKEILHNDYVDDSFDNVPISPADFLALTSDDVQDHSGIASSACTDLYTREIVGDEPKKPEFEPKQWVLGRVDPSQPWILDIFSNIDDDSDEMFIYVCIGTCWADLIPYEGNEHLCGQVGEP